MDVHVSDGLAGGRPIVDADVEGVRGELGVENPLLFSDDLEQRGLLLERQFEKRPHVSMRDRERVTRRDGIAVADGKGEGIRCHDPASVHLTKRAFGGHVPFYPNIERERCLSGLIRATPERKKPTFCVQDNLRIDRA